MSDQVLWNSLKELGKRDKKGRLASNLFLFRISLQKRDTMLGKPRILSLLINSIIQEYEC